MRSIVIGSFQREPRPLLLDASYRRRWKCPGQLITLVRMSGTSHHRVDTVYSPVPRLLVSAQVHLRHRRISCYVYSTRIVYAGNGPVVLEESHPRADTDINGSYLRQLLPFLGMGDI